MTAENHPIIDAHVMLGSEHPLALRLDDLLHTMDAHGVTTAIARPLGAHLVIENRPGNDRLLSAGPRIKALVTVNPWCGPAAIDELERCRELGATGLFLHPARQGFMPLEQIATPLLDFAARIQWPVMFHTGTFAFSDVLAVGEVARRYPTIPFILGCGGFADMWFEVPGVMESVPNLWLETSHILGTGIRTVLKGAGAQRVVFGSGEPSNRCSCALKTLANLSLDADSRRRILYENSLRLFNLG